MAENALHVQITDFYDKYCSNITRPHTSRTQHLWWCKGQGGRSKIHFCRIYTLYIPHCKPGVSNPITHWAKISNLDKVTGQQWYLLLIVLLIININLNRSGSLKGPPSLRLAEERTHLHDERRAGGHIGLLGLQLPVGVVESIPGGAHHVDHVCVDHREVGETTRGDAQHAEVVVQRRRAVFDLDALLLVVHGFGNGGQVRQNGRELSVVLSVNTWEMSPQLAPGEPGFARRRTVGLAQWDWLRYATSTWLPLAS